MQFLKTWIFLALTACLGLTLPAKGFDFSCANCHETPTKVLPKKHPKQTNFNSCTSCHGSKVAGLALKVHKQHFDGRDIKPDTCLDCHPQGADKKVTLSASKGVVVAEAGLSDLAESMTSWVKSDKLDHVHMLKGKSCGSCHTNYNEDDGDTYNAKCQSCHGDYTKMAATRTRFAERNPHKAPHATMYPGMKCAGCHQVHAPFRDSCASCHGVRFDWKRKP